MSHWFKGYLSGLFRRCGIETQGMRARREATYRQDFVALRQNYFTASPADKQDIQNQSAAYVQGCGTQMDYYLMLAVNDFIDYPCVATCDPLNDPDQDPAATDFIIRLFSARPDLARGAIDKSASLSGQKIIDQRIHARSVVIASLAIRACPRLIQDAEVMIDMMCIHDEAMKTGEPLVMIPAIYLWLDMGKAYPQLLNNSDQEYEHGVAHGDEEISMHCLHMLGHLQHARAVARNSQCEHHPWLP